MIIRRTIRPLNISRLTLAFACLSALAPPGALARSRPRPALARAAIYYIDARTGSDDNPGTSRRTPWRSIARVGRAVFGPGDQILFAGGQRFGGTLQFTKGSGGLPERPVRISSFGKGRAVIDAGTGSGCVLSDCAWIVIENLAVAGRGRKSGSDGAGISLLRTRSVTLNRIDASGFRLGGVTTAGDENTRISHVCAHENGAAGICVNSDYEGVPRTRNLLISDCSARNNAGDPGNLTNHSGNGIVVGGADGARVEYCEASGNGWDMPRTGNGPVGIWGWNCDRLVIAHCISHDNSSPGTDGGGFDLDGGVTNSVMEYNLSYNNAGCGYLLCQYAGAPPWRNNIVRYNISAGDGARNFHCGIGIWPGGDAISGAAIYNNTVVNSAHAVSAVGDMPGLVWRNNIFVGGDDLLYGDLAQSRFDRNLYWSDRSVAIYRDGATGYQTISAWTQAAGQEMADGKSTGLWADPRLVLPAPGETLPADPRRLVQMRFFRLRAGSAAARAGAILSEHGGSDLFGRSVPVRGPVSLGAYEADETKLEGNRGEK